jgi:hypothetical protein
VGVNSVMICIDLYFYLDIELCSTNSYIGDCK